MTDERDDYLFEGKGEPDPEVTRLERGLAPLRYVAGSFAPRPAAAPRRDAGARRGTLVGAALMLAAAFGAIAAVALAPGVQIEERSAARAVPRPPATALAATAVATSTAAPPAGEGALAQWVAGSPRVGGEALASTAALPIGAALETDARSRARIDLGGIGTVEVEAGSRVRVVEAGAGQRRIDLDRGEISARVDAPPRLFVVGTPSATAVDLGCAYRLRVDASGGAWLAVTHGYVSLEGDGGTSALVPAGAECSTRPPRRIGTPRFSDAPRAFATAVDRFDATGDVEPVLAAVDIARDRAPLTLWHMLLRVPASQRARVYARLVALVPPPSGVALPTGEVLDRAALEPYEELLRDLW